MEVAAMRIGIIGSGNIGGTLTRRLSELGHEVEVANSRGPESLTALAGETGARPVTVEEAAGADLVVVAIPLKAVPGLPAALLTGKVVVDANNYYPARDGQIEPIDGGTTSTRWVADHLRGARLVKAFNTMRAQHLLEDGRPSGDPRRLALPVASDDDDAKQVVSSLIDDLGFDPVDGGDLDGSWRQQPGAPIYGADLDAESVRDGLAAAQR
jgi:predicted dinucleotide-binding enzyme